jgi:hypothetical protein
MRSYCSGSIVWSLIFLYILDLYEMCSAIMTVGGKSHGALKPIRAEEYAIPPVVTVSGISDEIKNGIDRKGYNE